MKEIKKDNKLIGVQYEKEDYLKLKIIYTKWKDINQEIKKIADNARAMNLPEIVSEGMYSYLFECIRTNVSGSSSADLITYENKKIQVKAATIKNDLTSFGPKSEWDILIFMDFSVLDEVSIYEIPSNKVYEKVLDKEKGETFKMQQDQGRRPRLSLKKIIDENGIVPKKKEILK